VLCQFDNKGLAPASYIFFFDFDLAFEVRTGKMYRYTDVYRYFDAGASDIFCAENKELGKLAKNQRGSRPSPVQHTLYKLPMNGVMNILS
jgi:hypothetical protein